MSSAMGNTHKKNNNDINSLKNAKYEEDNDKHEDKTKNGTIQ